METQETEKKLKLWIARESGKNGYLSLFNEEPTYETEYSDCGLLLYDCWTDGNAQLVIEDRTAFPEVTFENSPRQVEVKLLN